MEPLTSPRVSLDSFRLQALVVAAVMMAVSALGAIADAQPAAAFAPGHSRPVLFVHGVDVLFTKGTNCGADFDQMIGQMRSDGFVGGPLIKVGYYHSDTNCDLNLHSYAYYSDEDSWKEMAKAFSWYVYGEFTRHGIAVDVVGYSMGGLIARGAIWGSQKREAGFAPPLWVNGAVTMGTPHEGQSAYTSSLCPTHQCRTMIAGSPDLNWLNQNRHPSGENPETGGTLWTLIGSDSDGYVPWRSAISMNTAVDRKTVFAGVHHLGGNNYMHNWAVIDLVSNSLGVRSTRIWNPGTGKCMDIRAGNAAPFTPVQTYDCNGQFPQLWTHGNQATWGTINALGRCLARGGSGNNQPVYILPCSDSPGQNWFQGYDGTIRTPDGYCLDIPGGGYGNGLQLRTWYCNGSYAQNWQWLY